MQGFIMKYCFFDTETTGLKPDRHELISFAIILHNNDKEIYRTHQKITPLRLNEADPEALKVNGYTYEGWKNSIHSSKAAQWLGNFFDQRPDMVIVGHNPLFDIEFVKALVCPRHPNFKLKNRYIDTKHLALASLFPLGLKSCRLDDIRRFLGWSLEGAHDALVDTEHVRDLFYLCRRDLKKLEWKFSPDGIQYT